MPRVTYCPLCRRCAKKNAHGRTHIVQNCQRDTVVNSTFLFYTVDINIATNPPRFCRILRKLVARESVIPHSSLIRYLSTRRIGHRCSHGSHNTSITRRSLFSRPAMAPLVDNPQIKGAELLTPLPIQFHTYVWPFAIVWPIFLRYYLTPSLYEAHIQSSEWTFVWIAAIVTVQSLFWLSTHWSVNVKGIFTSTKAKTIQDAKTIKVIPVANAGAADICALIHEKVRGNRASSYKGEIKLTNATPNRSATT